MTKHIRHVRHHARKHHEAHERLKELLSRVLYVEKVWGVFVGTFVITIVTIIIFLNWTNIVSFFQGDPSEKKEEEISEEVISGFQKGVLATYQINGQTADQYIRFVRQIGSQGYLMGITAIDTIGKGGEEKAEERKDALMGSIFMTTDLSKGQHLTSMRSGSGLLQKSLLTTYYMGEKTIDISSTLQTDAKLLSQISNTLSVDLFAYLNQSSERATTLNNYLNLLIILQEKAQARTLDLTSKINFLNANFSAQEQAIKLTEDAFFNNLSIFDGENAETELAEFIGLGKEQTEIRAKMGAYEGIKNYYEFFLPKLDNLIRAIKANRDPLIAGVKVVEIQNMTLPLIIRER